MAWKLRLKTAGAGPVYRRIDAAVREGIAGGHLKPGDRLPSVAALSKEIGVNKLTVLKAFRGLEKEGLVRSHVGRGTFVHDGAPPRGPSPAGDPPTGGEPGLAVARAMRRMREGYARGVRDLMRVERRPGTIDLSGGVPSPDTVPDGLLETLSKAVLRRNARRLYAYGGPAGLPELREAIAKTLSRRGTVVSADEVLVTNGSQQAISLVAAWAREDGRSVLCETPTFTGVPGAFMLFDHAVQSVPWRDGSLDLEALAASAGRRPLAYVCPDFHNPTGQTLTDAARRGVAAWARATDAVVLDDEIFREMRFEGEEPESLYSMLPAGRRFLVGSVSKSFMTGLRVGYLVADAPLVSDLLLYKRYMDLGGPSFVQAIAAAFLREGYAEHLETMRGYYRARRDAALLALEEHMPRGTTWTRPEGGFQLWVTLPAGISAVEVFLRGIERGVAIVPGPAHDVDGRYVNCFRLGYGDATPARIAAGVERLAEVAKSLLDRGPREPAGPGLTL